MYGFWAIALFLTFDFFSSLSTYARAEGPLSVSLLISSGEMRTYFQNLVDDFAKENNTVVSTIVKDDGGYKEEFNKWMSGSEKNIPDVLYWQAGERLASLVREGKFADITGLWNEGKMDTSFSSALKNAVSVDEKVYAIPVSYYHWGIYYNREVFKKLKLSPPTNWEELLKVGSELNAHNISPVTLGTKWNEVELDCRGLV